MDTVKRQAAFEHIPEDAFAVPAKRPCRYRCPHEDGSCGACRRAVLDTRRAQLIALYSPAAGSGKSEVSSVLEREFGFQVVKFAGPLKDMVRGLLRGMGQFDSPTIERMIEGDLKEQVVPGFATVTPRHLMQTLGTDWGREAVDQNLWVKVAISRAEMLLRAGMSVVIDDLRFPNELEAIRAIGGRSWRIHRPDPSRQTGSTRYEGLLEGNVFSQYVENDSSLAELHEQVRGLVG